MSRHSADGREGDRRRVDASVATIDEALESGHVTAIDPEDRALQELALALREESPRPSEDFSHRLDERVAAGFPRERDGRARRLVARLGLAGERREPSRRSSSRFVPRRPSLPVLAGATSVLVVLLVAGSALTTSSPPPETGQTIEAPVEGDGAAIQAAPDAAPEPPVAADSGPGETPRQQRAEELALDGRNAAPSPVPPPPGADAGSGRENRQVERTAQMELAAPEEELDRVGAGIASIADRRDGFLLSSSLSTGQGGSGGGTFELRVPVEELEATIADLSRLGEVRSLTQSGEDLTAQVVTTDRAADRARARRAELEDRLETADEDDQPRLRQRIEVLTVELRSARGQSRGLEQRVSFATVFVTAVEGEGTQGVLGGALDDMVGLLEGALALALRVLGVALPVGLAVALVVVVARAGRRRRRESTLA